MKLEDLEARIQRLVEVNLMNLFKARRVESRFAQLMASAMQINLRLQPDRTVLAPNVYVVAVHPSMLIEWQTDTPLLEELSNALNTAGSEAGYRFISPPTISLAADPSLSQDDMRVLASFSMDRLAETKGMVPDVQSEGIPETVPCNAFLIMQGTKVIPLEQTVINIGRHLDNHIVIDDPRVSRSHAQLRVIKDRYVIFDLNSTGGTLVNGERINQSALYPGDTISLAGVTLIFGQDLPASKTREETTEPGSPHSVDRSTEFYPKTKDRNS